MSVSPTSNTNNQTENVPTCSSISSSCDQSGPSEEQKLRIEENRRKAQDLLKRKREFSLLSPQKKKNIQTKPIVIDTGGGFLLDENDLKVAEVQRTQIYERPEPILPPNQPTCMECKKKYSGSYLLEKFDYSVCDDCRDPKEKHSLITKTEAKKNYLLTDVDLEQRGTPLKFIIGKNPHNSRWNDMKLYLLVQVEERALEIWGSEEELLDELERREEKRSLTKQKSYRKKMNALRMSIRSSLYTKELTQNHTHEYGEEEYDSSEDTYSHICNSCGFKETYEKM